MASRYGQGTVFYDEKRRRWVGFLEAGIGPDGNRIRKKVMRPTRGEVLLALRDLSVERDKGTLVTGKALTTGAWLDFWATAILPGTVAASTERQYAQVVKDWISPYIGRIRLEKLRPDDVVAMMRALEAKGLSTTTQRMARTVLRRSLNHAIRFGRVSRNVAALTDAPKHAESKLDDALDSADAAAVLEAAKGDRLEALAVLVLALGLRQGEALDLTWRDVDLDKGVLAVRGTKTESSVRKVALPAFVVAALRRHRSSQREERMAAPVWADPSLMFTTTVGTRIHRRNALRWWHGLTVDAGVGRRRFHASRHTAATLMLNNGVPLEVVSATLGHAGLAITADVYAKVRPELQRTAADAMQKVLGGP